MPALVTYEAHQSGVYVLSLETVVAAGAKQQFKWQIVTAFMDFICRYDNLGSMYRPRTHFCKCHGVIAV